MEKTVAASKRRRVLGGTLSVVGGGAAVGIGREPVLVGRDASCHLVVDEARVSAVHAELVATDRGVRLRDLGSRNGTWVGDTRVVEAYLTADADVWVGEVELCFEPARPKRVALPDVDRFGPLYGTSGAMRALFQRMAKIAPTDLGVLILGETGTGKELIAQALHDASPRAGKSLAVVDCGAIPPSLAEASLFGHERGAYTGAVDRRAGPFVEADGGTVFLDELGELPLEVQPKLLRALAERRVKPVGGSRYVPVDVRVLAATRRDLRAAVNAGEFRSDLFFRVAQLTVDVPRLRDRVEDVPGLVAHLLAELGDPRAIRRVSHETMERLLRHDWPGNVRELRNAVSVAHAMAEDRGPLEIAAYVGQLAEEPEVLSARGAPARFRDAKRQVIERFEREYFRALVAASGGNVSEMARVADMERAQVRRYLERHGISKKG